MTLRDQVWDEALEQLMTTGKFKLSDLPFDESERHTVRRVLRQMEEHNWLSRETEHSSIWRMGEKSEQYLAVAPNVVQKAKP